MIAAAPGAADFRRLLDRLGVQYLDVEVYSRTGDVLVRVAESSEATKLVRLLRQSSAEVEINRVNNNEWAVHLKMQKK